MTVLLNRTGRMYGYAASSGITELTLLDSGDFGANLNEATKTATVDLSGYDGAANLYVLVNLYPVANAITISASLASNPMTKVVEVINVDTFRPTATCFKLSGLSLGASESLVFTPSSSDLNAGAWAIFAAPGSTGETATSTDGAATDNEATLSLNVGAGDDVIGLVGWRTSGTDATSTWTGLTEDIDGLYTDITTPPGNRGFAVASARNVSAATPRTITCLNNEISGNITRFAAVAVSIAY